jgi:hypothetical protein
MLRVPLALWKPYLVAKQLSSPNILWTTESRGPRSPEGAGGVAAEHPEA